MKEYLILKDFTGSQTGLDTDEFIAGTTRKLSDSLVQALGGTASGYLKEPGKAAKDIAAAPKELADAVLDTIADPESRETKVTGPAETKPAKPLSKMSKAELVAHALQHGLELVPDSMTAKEMITAIEAHTAA